MKYTGKEIGVDDWEELFNEPLKSNEVVYVTVSYCKCNPQMFGIFKTVKDALRGINGSDSERDLLFTITKVELNHSYDHNFEKSRHVHVIC